MQKRNKNQLVNDMNTTAAHGLGDFQTLFYAGN